MRLCAQARRGLWLGVCGVLVWLAGCAFPSSSSVERAVLALPDLGFMSIDTPPHIKAWLKRDEPSQRVLTSSVLHVYLEGDGAAWWAQRLPPADPTPLSSVALPLALADRHSRVAYLGRPCQFLSAVERPLCPVQWWTSERWGEAVVEITAQALDRLLQASGAHELVLIGHSGGGTLALLVAARRRDVRCVVTMASPLDIQAWAQGQGMTPLSGSLNPADLPMPAGVFQERHLLGEDDRVVPLSSMGRYEARLHPEHVMRLPHQGHSQGWVQRWQGAQASDNALSTWLRGCLHPH
jgi:predicted alpha/beta hydrolase family esterase